MSTSSLLEDNFTLLLPPWVWSLVKGTNNFKSWLCCLRRVPGPTQVTHRCLGFEVLAVVFCLRSFNGELWGRGLKGKVPVNELCSLSNGPDAWGINLGPPHYPPWRCITPHYASLYQSRKGRGHKFYTQREFRWKSHISWLWCFPKEICILRLLKSFF